MSTVITKNTSDLVQLLEKANNLPDIGGSIVIKNQNKTITENGVYTADNGYTGLGVVTVNVPNSGTVELQEKTVTPKREDQTVTFDSGYDGLSQVVVRAIPEQYGLITYDQDKTITIT